MASFKKKEVATTEDKAQYFLNVYFKDTKVGYLVLDSFDNLVELLKNNPEKATAFIQKCEAKFTIRGESSKKLDLSEI